MPGDLNNDACVDQTDATLVARSFGPVAPPADSSFDLDRNGVVDYADFEIQLAGVTSTCGANPCSSGTPVVCKGNTRVVIDRELIADGAVTIDARGTCDALITNSLIVSGKNSITITGDVLVTIDNGIIVGQNAVLAQQGSRLTSAGNTSFHGVTSFQTALFLECPRQRLSLANEQHRERSSIAAAWGAFCSRGPIRPRPKPSAANSPPQVS